MSIVCGVVMLLIGIDTYGVPFDKIGEKHTPLGIIGALVALFGQVLWISMDRRRRGLEIGPWRALTIFLGPLAISIYLILEYRIRSLFLIPIVVAVYFGTFIIPITIVIAMRGWHA